MKFDNRLLLPIIYKDSENREKDSLFNGLIEFYNSHFVSLVNSLGYGIILTKEYSLIPKIDFVGTNIRFTLQPGAFIDKDGRLVIVPKESDTKNFNIEGYRRVFFYIKTKIDEDSDIQKSGKFIIKNTILDYEIFISPDPDYRYIELCRVQLDKENEILLPKNPFFPKSNEIDLRFVPRIVSNHSLSQDIKDEIAQHLYLFGDFFTKLAPKIGSFTAPIVASEAYNYASKIKMNNVITFDIYNMLSRVVHTLTIFYNEVEDKIENLKDSYSGKKIKRLESIFSIKNSNRYRVDFYNINLHENSSKENLWENIFSEIKGLYESNDSWKLIKKSIVSTKKDYLLVGRAGTEGVDIEIDNEWVSANHLKITKNDIDPTLVDIEDLGSTNGTYLKGIRYEKNKKVTLHRGDKVNLYTYEFDIYNHSVVKDFLEGNI